MEQFVLPLNRFDLGLLPEAGRDTAYPAFREAVDDYFRRRFREKGPPASLGRKNFDVPGFDMSGFCGGSVTLWWCFQLCAFDRQGFCSRTHFTDLTPLIPPAQRVLPAVIQLTAQFVRAVRNGILGELALRDVLGGLRMAMLAYL
jgi:hypothetical protein